MALFNDNLIVLLKLLSIFGVRLNRSDGGALKTPHYAIPDTIVIN